MVAMSTETLDRLEDHVHSLGDLLTSLQQQNLKLNHQINSLLQERTALIAKNKATGDRVRNILNKLKETK
jgi:uncharacterized protein (TIGR02449 family)